MDSRLRSQRHRQDPRLTVCRRALSSLRMARLTPCALLCPATTCTSRLMLPGWSFPVSVRALSIAMDTAVPPGPSMGPTSEVGTLCRRSLSMLSTQMLQRRRNWRRRIYRVPQLREQWQRKRSKGHARKISTLLVFASSWGSGTGKCRREAVILSLGYGKQSRVLRAGSSVDLARWCQPPDLRRIFQPLT